MALTGGCLTNNKPLETIASEFGSAAGYGLALLGQICRWVFTWSSSVDFYTYVNCETNSAYHKDGTTYTRKVCTYLYDQAFSEKGVQASCECPRFEEIKKNFTCL